MKKVLCAAIFGVLALAIAAVPPMPCRAAINPVYVTEASPPTFDASAVCAYSPEQPAAWSDATLSAAEGNQMVRAKFTVTKVEGNAVDPGEGGAVYLSPVISGSDENEQFYKYTPGGSIMLSTINEKALAQFEAGKEYYVDFTPADASKDETATRTEPKPTIGRIVHYVLLSRPDAHRPAIITGIDPDNSDLVNLQVFGDGGSDGLQYIEPRYRVMRRDDHPGNSWHWPERE